MNIEDVVNSTAKAMLDFWLRHWPICLLTLCAVLDFLDNNDSVSRIIFAASFVATVVCLKAFRLERCFWIYVLVFIGIIAFFFADIESNELQSTLHLDVECQHVVHPPSLEAGGFLPRAECGRKKLYRCVHIDR